MTIYRKPACGLCDQAEATLARIAKRLPLRITEVNIESDASLFARYGEHIPVIAVGGHEVARAPISEATLEATLKEVSLA
ncbi:MAG: glutaredoxin family protein [Dehalococcoidia bacterium]